MEGSSHGSSNSPAPFLTKTYEMVDDPSTDSIVSWSPNDASFVVWNPPDFARDLLPKYFKHSNFSSFVRQLNTYGFRKIDPDQWEFANDDFRRGQRHLLKNIRRRKPIHSHSLHHQGQGPDPLGESERHELEEEIEKLKSDKGMLVVELQKHTHQQLGIERQMQSLGERLLGVESRQKNMMANLTRYLQKPGFLSDKLHGKKRRLAKIDLFYEGAASMHMINTDAFEKIESSLNSLESLLREVSRASGGGVYYDGVTDENLWSPSPISSPGLGDDHSSPELVESTSHPPSPNPKVLLIELHTDTRSKVSEIDVNSEPSGPEIHPPRDRIARAGVNDVFWEQFLTETPGSSEMQEVQSERRGGDDDKRSLWWNRKNVENKV
uniref:Heat shock transcription factor A4b n=1 Tax=Narcissus tazetta subsp. chinensis TaxID=391288 RepID=A0A411JIJ5_NARTA|nr:heat shock transcription factor A4b [Narcissus tazetta subsp. chinensis]